MFICLIEDLIHNNHMRIKLIIFVSVYKGNSISISVTIYISIMCMYLTSSFSYLIKYFVWHRIITKNITSITTSAQLLLFCTMPSHPSSLCLLVFESLQVLLNCKLKIDFIWNITHLQSSPLSSTATLNQPNPKNVEKIILQSKIMQLCYQN